MIGSQKYISSQEYTKSMVTMYRHEVKKKIRQRGRLGEIKYVYPNHNYRQNYNSAYCKLR